MQAEKLFPESEQELIEQAIADAELQTSGEIRVHIENFCPEDVMDRASFIFEELAMQNTVQRNGVLIYLSTESRQFAILGDAGINAVVSSDFWTEIKDGLRKFLREKKHTEGLCYTVQLVGESLKAHFPYQKGDSNELDNKISFGQ